MFRAQDAEEEEEELEEDDDVLGGLSLDDDDDDEFPTLEDDSLPVSRHGMAEAQERLRIRLRLPRMVLEAFFSFPPRTPLVFRSRIAL